MSGITDPAEEYFKNGLWGWDPSTEAWRKLTTTWGAHTLEVKLGASAEVHQDTPADLLVGPHGWDGDSWQKLPMLWGYSDRYAENVTAAAIGGGNAEVGLTGPVAGEVFVIQAITVYHDAGVNKVLYVYAFDGANDLRLIEQLVAVSGTRYVWNGELVIKNPDRIWSYLGAPGAGKSVFLKAWGYKMKVAE